MLKVIHIQSHTMCETTQLISVILHLNVFTQQRPNPGSQIVIFSEILTVKKYKTAQNKKTAQAKVKQKLKQQIPGIGI